MLGFFPLIYLVYRKWARVQWMTALGGYVVCVCVYVVSSCLSVWVTEHFHCWLRLLNNAITPVVIRSSDLRWTPDACLLSHILYSNPHTYLMLAHIRHWVIPTTHTFLQEHTHTIWTKHTHTHTHTHTHRLKSNRYSIKHFCIIIPRDQVSTHLSFII